MKFLSPIVAVSVLVILAYAIFFKKSPEQVKTKQMEIGTLSETPIAPAPKLSMPTHQTDRNSIKKVAAKSKPRSFKFVAQKKRSGDSSKSIANVTGMTPAAEDYNLIPADKEQALKVQTAKNMINPQQTSYVRARERVSEILRQLIAN